MRNPIARVAAVAALVALAVLGLSEFLGSGATSGVVWAQVAERVESSGGVIARMWNSQTQPGLNQPVEWEAKIYSSPQYGYRMESFRGDQPETTFICNNAERKMVVLMHSLKRYARKDLSGEMLDEIAQKQADTMDPKALVRQLLSGGYTELGRRTIDGEEAEGVQIDNPPAGTPNFQVDRRVMQLWVSVRTGYPVRIDSDVVGNNGTLHITQVLDQFEWNVELGPELFQLEVPPGYTETEMPQS